MKKPSVVYRNRMERYDDDAWLIWSNENGCWYRDKSQGYTSDIAQAGTFSKEEAAMHYTPMKYPKSYRVTEPFPLSAVKAMLLRNRKAILDEATERVAKIDAILDRSAKE